MLKTKNTTKIRNEKDHLLLADACWIAVALLLREHRSVSAFTAQEIVERLETTKLTSYPRSSIAAHLSQHCVANVPPTSGKYRLLWRENDGRLRLFRHDDFAHPARRGKDRPRREDIPDKYGDLLDWYQQTYSRQSSGSSDPVLAMVGVGRKAWKGIDPDRYVAELRSGWNAED